jgi:hypothetical protein
MEILYSWGFRIYLSSATKGVHWEATAGAKFGPNTIFCKGVHVEWSLTYWKLCYFTFFCDSDKRCRKAALSSSFKSLHQNLGHVAPSGCSSATEWYTVHLVPSRIHREQLDTTRRLNRRVFLDYLRPNRVLLNGWHLDSLSKKANFGDDSETYFWLLSKKWPRCALERALGFSKLFSRASEIKNWQRTTRYKIEAENSWTPCS